MYAQGAYDDLFRRIGAGDATAFPDFLTTYQDELLRLIRHPVTLSPSHP